MALQRGERYRCPDPDCGCEIEVTKGLPRKKAGIYHLDAVAAKRCKKHNVAPFNVRFATISVRKGTFQTHNRL